LRAIGCTALGTAVFVSQARMDESADWLEWYVLSVDSL
jgi:hypothetical protein